MSEFRTIQQVADYLGVHHRTVRAWIESGKLEAVKVGRLYRVPEDALRDFVGKEWQQQNGNGQQQDNNQREAVIVAGKEGLAEKFEALAAALHEARLISEEIQDSMAEEVAM